MNFSEFALLLERGPGALELLGELLGVRLQPHAAQLLLHLPHLHTGDVAVVSAKSMYVLLYSDTI